MGFSLFFWRKNTATATQDTPEVRHGLHRMAETLAELTKKTQEQLHHSTHHEAHHEHRESHELMLPKHEEHFLIPDHHADKHYIPDMASTPVMHLDLAARATNAFYAQDGSAFWTLGEFADALLRMSPGTFSHHVSAGRNDFASWVEGCFNSNEKAFAQRLRGLGRDGMLTLFLEQGRTQEARQQPREDIVHHDDKGPVTVEWRGPDTSARSSNVASILEELGTARIAAAVDLAVAREKFIATRVKVFSTLTEEERAQVLPKLRDTYEYLRHAH